MHVRAILYAVCIALLGLPVYAGAGCTVDLNNGQSFEAQFCTVNGKTVSLEYKTGSASIPKNTVKSLKDEKGDVSFLSEPGTEKPAPPPPEPEARAAAPENVEVPVLRNKMGRTDEDPSFYEGAWPEEKAFMKGEKHPFNQ